MRVLPRVLRRKANCLYDSFQISSNIKSEGKPRKRQPQTELEFLSLFEQAFTWVSQCRRVTSNIALNIK